MQAVSPLSDGLTRRRVRISPIKSGQNVVDNSISMIVVYSEVFAAFKTVVHLVAALAIMWFCYRVANGEFSFL